MAGPLVSSAHAKPKKVPRPSKPAPTTQPTSTSTSEPEKPEKPKTPPKMRVEFGACTPESLAEAEGSALVTMLRKRCRNLRVPAGSAPTDLSDDDMLVALCIRETEGEEPEAVEPKECGLRAVIEVDGSPPIPFSLDGDLAMTLRTTKVVKQTSPSNGTHVELVVTSENNGTPAVARSPLVYRRGFEGYGHGRWIWFPLPMLTTDFSSSAAGYRLGITPLAVAAGGKIFPGASRGYFGMSAFVAWNLLVPNDTQTLSNGTFVRINYKAMGFGVLLDGSGWLSVGVGVGHTFTTDARTDFRTWIYLGPRLLGFLNEL